MLLIASPPPKQGPILLHRFASSCSLNGDSLKTVGVAGCGNPGVLNPAKSLKARQSLQLESLLFFCESCNRSVLDGILWIPWPPYYGTLMWNLKNPRIEKCNNLQTTPKQGPISQLRVKKARADARDLHRKSRGGKRMLYLPQ